jgi:hypothetical protein
VCMGGVCRIGGGRLVDVGIGIGSEVAWGDRLGGQNFGKERLERRL